MSCCNIRSDDSIAFFGQSYSEKKADERCSL
jgi:hypothetical protein